MPQHPASSLRVRLLLLVLLAVLPVLGLLLSSAVEGRREGAARAQESAARIAYIASQGHEATIQETGLLLSALSQLPLARSGDPELCRRALAPILETYPRYLNLGVANPDTTLLCSVRPVPPGTPAGEGLRTAMGESLRTGDLGTSGYAVGTVSGQPVMIFTHPVRDEAGAIRSVMYAALRLDWLQEFAADARLPAGATLRVVDALGGVMVRFPAAGEPEGRSIAGTPLFERIRASADGDAFTVLDAAGEAHLHAATRLVDHRGETQAYLDVGLPARLAFAAVDRSLRRNLLWLGLLAALSMAAAWYGGDFFLLRRVDALLAATRRLQAGDLSARSGLPSGPGELEQLAGAFDEMAETLQARQREAERTAETLRRQALLFDTLLEGVMVTDAEGRIIDWNRAAEGMFGYAREEVLGRSPEILHDPGIAAGLEAEIVGAMDATGRWAGEVPFVRKDGTRGISEAVVVAQYDERGERVAHVGVNRDVTARHAAERALRESEEQFRTVFEHAPVGIAEGGVRSGRILVNPSLQRLLDLPAECSPDDLAARSHPEDANEDRRLFDELLAGERDGYRTEKRYLRPDGGEVCGILRVTLVREADGTPRSVFALVEDVTERKRTEAALARSQEELRHAQKMEAVGRLAGGVAHDFNNLLTAIKGNVELALLDLPSASPLRGELEQIQQAADTASSLTRQLLAFSSNRPRQPSTVDVDAVVAGTAQLLRRMIGSSVELETALEADAGPILADPGQLEQILINLAINARDAMPDGGRLRIETRSVELGEDAPGRPAALAPGRYVELAVRDTGTGIEPGLLPRIFEPFFSTKERERGTGLGLFIVYGIVTQSGGHVRVESEPGAGTAVHVLLPCTERGEDVAPPASAAGPAAEAGQGTILLVDDEDSVRLLAHRLLQRIGYHVLSARDGAEALRISAGHEGPIHLLLTDMTMPRMNGAELAERIAAARPRTRVVYMSGYTEESLPRDRETGAPPAFVHKPFTVNVLANAVRQALGSAG